MRQMTLFRLLKNDALGQAVCAACHRFTKMRL